SLFHFLFPCQIPHRDLNHDKRNTTKNKPTTNRSRIRHHKNSARTNHKNLKGMATLTGATHETLHAVRRTGKPGRRQQDHHATSAPNRGRIRSRQTGPRAVTPPARPGHHWGGVRVSATTKHPCCAAGRIPTDAVAAGRRHLYCCSSRTAARAWTVARASPGLDITSRDRRCAVIGRTPHARLITVHSLPISGPSTPGMEDGWKDFGSGMIIALRVQQPDLRFADLKEVDVVDQPSPAGTWQEVDGSCQHYSPQEALGPGPRAVGRAAQFGVGGPVSGVWSIPTCSSAPRARTRTPVERAHHRPGDRGDE
ncbi:hypothetical protein IWX63_003342, partial [Arthrobacter sp. CAN_A2]